jgi:hypothetical protein
MPTTPHAANPPIKFGTKYWGERRGDNETTPAQESHEREQDGEPGCEGANLHVLAQ